MPPRHRIPTTDPLTRLRNEMDALGRPGMAGTSRVGFNQRGRGGGQSVLANAGDGADETTGAAQLLVLSAAGVDVVSGDVVPFATVVAQHGFDRGVQPSGGYWVHPVAGVYLLTYDHEWATFTGGGTVRLELDGDLPAEGTIMAGTDGRVGFGAIAYVAEAGQVGAVRVTHTGGFAQTCDATVRVAITDPDDVAAVVTSEWTKVFTADTWGITNDGTHWWTTPNTGLAVTKRNSAGAAVASFNASELSGDSADRVRGIALAGTDLWLSGAPEKLVRYSSTGTLEVSNDLSASWASEIGHQGVAFDGTDVWIAGADTDQVRRYSVAGSHLQTISVPFTPLGMTIWDGDLFIVSLAGTLERYTTAGAAVESIDLSGVGGSVAGVWIAADGTLYVSVDGDGVYRRATVVT